MRASLCGIAVVVAIAACGSGESKKSGDDSSPKVTPGDDPGKADVPAAPQVTVGVEQPELFNFLYGKGKKDYERAEKAAAGGDWKTAAEAAEAAVQADADHLDGHLLLARARAELGELDGVAEPLERALSADYLAYADSLADAGALGEAIASRSELERLVDAIRQSYLERAKSGLFVVARRTRFKSPSKTSSKVQWAATRGELYSYDRDSKRYLRLTHTKHALAGWLTAPSADELAFVAYSGVVNPPAEGAAPELGWAKVGVLDLDTLKPVAGPASVPGTPRRIRLAYRAGDELVVETSEAEGRWGTTEATTFTFDRARGKLKKVAAELTGEVLSVDFDQVRLDSGPAPEIQADSEATSFRLLPTNTTVTMPAGEVVAADGYVWSPDKVHLVVRTMARPCEGEPEASLYLVDAATGKLKHILRGRSLFQTRWIDNDHFVYQDDEGALRVYDVEQRTQVGRLETRGGLALTGVASRRGALCTATESAADELLDEDATGLEGAEPDE